MCSHNQTHMHRFVVAPHNSKQRKQKKRRGLFTLWNGHRKPVKPFSSFYSHSPFPISPPLIVSNRLHDGPRTMKSFSPTHSCMHVQFNSCPSVVIKWWNKQTIAVIIVDKYVNNLKIECRKCQKTNIYTVCTYTHTHARKEKREEIAMQRKWRQRIKCVI